jgi:hypothetical protein
MRNLRHAGWFTQSRFSRSVARPLISVTATASAQSHASVCCEMPKPLIPFSANSSIAIPEPQLTNSPLLTRLIRDGKQDSAITVYEKAEVELDRATGSTLEHNGIEIQDAISGTLRSPAQ